MKRDLSAMAARTHDLLVVGGGITGACIARDAALRGLVVAIIEKKDWSHATSAATSKLVHGGLRYLRNREFALIRESLAERRIWQRIAPHMVSPLPFLLPLYRGEGPGRAVLRIGLTLYDWLSFDRGWLDDPDQRLPGHRTLSASEAVACEPVLAAPGLTGALCYSDCQMYAPERLGLECVRDAVAAGAMAANGAEAVSFLNHDGRIAGALVRDRADGRVYALRARLTVNAAGPWADIVLGLAQGGTPSRRLTRSKGLHLIVRPLTTAHAITSMRGGGHFFVLPWRGRSILGTTDTRFDGDPDRVDVDAGEIAAFLASVNAGLPAARLSPSDVEHVYAGLRPLVDDGARDDSAAATYGASRRSEICDHAADGTPGLLSVIGGKWTTSRRLAERLVDRALPLLNRPAARATTAATPLAAGAVGRFRAFRDRLAAAHPAIPPASLEHLARHYGARAEEVIARAEGPLREPVAPGRPTLGAEIVHAVHDEMARTLEDVVMRRTGLGTLGPIGAPGLRRVARLMADELGWTAERMEAEIAGLAAFAAGPLALAAS